MNKSPLLAMLISLLSADVVAQEDPLESSRHSAGLSVGIIDHRYTGDAEVAGGISYQGPAFGLSYTGPQLRATGLIARFDGNHTLINLTGIGWLVPSFTLKRLNNTVLAVPIGALAAWMRTSGDDEIAPLGKHAVLLGAGGVIEHQIGSRTEIKLRAMPLAGVTNTEVSDLLGFSWAADAEARLEVDELFSSLGLTISYRFRYQVWNVNGSRVFPSLVDEAYDYTSSIHVISLELKF